MQSWFKKYFQCRSMTVIINEFAHKKEKHK